MIERERRCLRKAFTAALLAGSAPAVFCACTDESTSSMRDPGPQGSDDASVDRSTGEAAIDDGREAGLDAAPPPHVDAACQTSFTHLFDAGIGDTGLDADPELFESCFMFLPCGLPTGVGAVGCEIVMPTPDDAATLDAAIGCRVAEDAGCSGSAIQPGPLTLTCNCELFTTGGRRPTGLRPVRRVRAPDPLGDGADSVPVNRSTPSASSPASSWVPPSREA